MRFVITGDIHLSAFSNEPTVNGMPEKLYYNMCALENVVKYCFDNDIKIIVFSGDLIHTKSILHSVSQSVLLDFIRKYENQITFIMIDGNHDMSSKSGEGVSALKCCDNEPNVITIHESREIDNIWFVPWNPKTMMNDIKKGSPNNAPYLISHFGLNEGKVNSGISIVSDVGLKDLKQYKRVFLSHYHTPQEVGNVIYTGSLIQLDWGDKNEEKRFLDVDSETDKVLSIPSTGFKKYYEFNITKENSEDVLKEIEKLNEEGHLVKLRKKEEVLLDEISKNIIVIDDIEDDITNRGINSSMTMFDKLNKYMEIKNVNPDDIDEYRRIGLDLINSCTN